MYYSTHISTMLSNSGSEEAHASGCDPGGPRGDEVPHSYATHQRTTEGKGHRGSLQGPGSHAAQVRTNTRRNHTVRETERSIQVCVSFSSGMSRSLSFISLCLLIWIIWGRKTPTVPLPSTSLSCRAVPRAARLRSPSTLWMVRFSRWMFWQCLNHSCCPAALFQNLESTSIGRFLKHTPCKLYSLQPNVSVKGIQECTVLRSVEKQTQIHLI